MASTPAIKKATAAKPPALWDVAYLCDKCYHSKPASFQVLGTAVTQLAKCPESHSKASHVACVFARPTGSTQAQWCKARQSPPKKMAQYKLCGYFKAGFCKNGSDCFNAHSTPELALWERERVYQLSRALAVDNVPQLIDDDHIITYDEFVWVITNYKVSSCAKRHLETTPNATPWLQCICYHDDSDERRPISFDIETGELLPMDLTHFERFYCEQYYKTVKCLYWEKNQCLARRACCRWHDPAEADVVQDYWRRFVDSFYESQHVPEEIPEPVEVPAIAEDSDFPPLPGERGSSPASVRTATPAFSAAAVDEAPVESAAASVDSPGVTAPEGVVLSAASWKYSSGIRPEVAEAPVGQYQPLDAPNSNVYFDPTDVIGNGSYETTVYRGRFKPFDAADAQWCAIKVVKGSDDEDDAIEIDKQISKILKREIESLQKINHPNVVRVFVQSCATFNGVAKYAGRSLPFLVLEFFGQSLHEFMLRGTQTQTGERFTNLFSSSPTRTPPAMVLIPTLMKELVRQFLSGIAAAHSKIVIHCDIRPPNVLVDLSRSSGDGVMVKVCDFGLSKAFDPELGTVRRTAATHQSHYENAQLWHPPEILVNTKSKERPPFSQKSDAFSCGIMTYFMLTNGYHLFYTEGTWFEFNNRDSFYELTQSIKTKNFTAERLDYDVYPLPEAHHLVMALVGGPELSAAQRLTPRQALSHPLWWSSEDKLEFLKKVQEALRDPENELLGQAARDMLEEESLKQCLIAIPAGTQWTWDNPAMGLHWLQVVQRAQESQKATSGTLYDTRLVLDLLRMMRNIQEHRKVSSSRDPQFSKAIRKLLGEPTADTLANFFLYANVPRLLIEVYKVVHRSGFAAQNEYIRNFLERIQLMASADYRFM